MIKKTAIILLFFFLTNSVFAIKIEKGEDIDFGDNFYDTYSNVSGDDISIYNFDIIDQNKSPVSSRMLGYIKFLTQGIKVEKIKSTSESLVKLPLDNYTLDDYGKKINDPENWFKRFMLYIKIPQENELYNYLLKKYGKEKLNDMEKNNLFEIYRKNIDQKFLKDKKLEFYQTNNKNYIEYNVISDKDQVINFQIFPVNDKKYLFYNKNTVSFLNGDKKNNTIKKLTITDPKADYYNMKFFMYKRNRNNPFYAYNGKINISKYLAGDNSTANGIFKKTYNYPIVEKKYKYNIFKMGNKEKNIHFEDKVILPYYDVKIPVKKGDYYFKIFYEDLFLDYKFNDEYTNFYIKNK